MFMSLQFAAAQDASYPKKKGAAWYDSSFEKSIIL
jgi:hypothetical protein